MFILLLIFSNGIVYLGYCLACFNKTEKDFTDGTR